MVFLPIIVVIGTVGAGIILFNVLRNRYRHYSHQIQIKKQWLAQTQKKQKKLHDELSKEINEILDQYLMFINIFCNNKRNQTEENAVLCEQVKRDIERLHRRIMLWENSLTTYHNRIVNLTKIDSKKESATAEQFAKHKNLTTLSNKRYFASELILVGIEIIQRAKKLCEVMHNEHPLVCEKIKKIFCEEMMKSLEELNSAYRSFEKQLKSGFKEHLKNSDKFIIVSEE